MEHATLLSAFEELLRRYGEDLQYLHERAEHNWNSLPTLYPDFVLDSVIETDRWPETNDAIMQFRTQSDITPYTNVDGVQRPHIVDTYYLVENWAQHAVHDPVSGGTITIETTPVFCATYFVDRDPVGTDTPTKVERTYIWVTNDTIWNVARRLNQDAQELLEHNGIYDWETIKPGDSLHLPRPTKRPGNSQNIEYELHTPAREMHITAESGAYKWSFGNAKDLSQIEKSGPTWTYNAPVDVVATAHVPLTEGTAHYYMTASDLGNYLETGRVTHTIGFNHTHLTDGPPEEIPPELPKPVVAPVETISDVQIRNPNIYKETWHRFKEPTWYRVKDGYGGDVFEFDGRAEPHWVEPGEKIMIIGTFERFDDPYYRPYTGKHNFWFGIHKKWLEEVPVDADIQELGTIPLPERVAAKLPLSTGEQAWDIFSRNVGKAVRISETVKKKVKGKL